MDDIISPASLPIIKELKRMEQEQIKESKKRTLKDIAAAELAWKFKSKQDFVVYLDQQ